MQLDFLEIGTSDFDTEIQRCDDTSFGISIDPVQYYIDRLPTKTNVTKLCTAISDRDGEVEVWYVPEYQMKKHNIPFWVRGCNSIGAPHPQVRELLSNLGLDLGTVCAKVKVPMMSFRTLVACYNINSIKFLKIDTEGHDCIILKSVLEELRDVKSNLKKPEMIQFETNHLSSKQDQDFTTTTFVNEFGYKASQVQTPYGFDCLLTL